MTARTRARPRMVWFCRFRNASAPSLMALEIFCICGVPVSWLMTYFDNPVATSKDRMLIPRTATRYCCPDPVDSLAWSHRASAHTLNGIRSNPPDDNGKKTRGELIRVAYENKQNQAFPVRYSPFDASSPR